MLRINNDNIESIKNAYCTKLKAWMNFEDTDKNKLLKQINKYNTRTKYCEMLRHLYDNFDNVIGSSFEGLMAINNTFITRFKNEYDEYLTKTNDEDRKETDFGYFKWRMVEYYQQFFSSDIKNDPDYNNFSAGRWLTKVLNVKVCPYCNHNYIFTINEKRGKDKSGNLVTTIVTRPQLDHFYSKSLNPLLALSFYNLVPSCSVCNTIKKDRDITFSPYDNKNTETYILSINSEGDENPSEWITGKGKIDIKIKHTYDGKTETPDNDIKNNVKQLGLNKIYEEHIDYVEEIVDKIYAYNKDYYKAMVDDFTGLGKSPNEIDVIIWNAYLKENEKRPMSKLTTDILRQLKLI